MRHDFDWSNVAVHSQSDQVDCESIDVTAKPTQLGIEFLDIPLTTCDMTSEVGSLEHCNTFNGTGGELTVYLHFSLPVHLRYQAASSTHQQYGAVRIPLPDVYVRSASTPAGHSPQCQDLSRGNGVRECVYHAGGSEGRFVRRYFDQTHLGRPSDSYSRMPTREEQYQPTLVTLGPLCGEEGAGELCVGDGLVLCSPEGALSNNALSECFVSMQMPLGDATQYSFVICVTVIVYSTTTFLLLWLLFRKTRVLVKNK
jgi:hypothetical protein